MQLHLDTGRLITLENSLEFIFVVSYKTAEALMNTFMMNKHSWDDMELNYKEDPYPEIIPSDVTPKNPKVTLHIKMKKEAFHKVKDFIRMKCKMDVLAGTAFEVTNN